jgi:hypothetical protein
MAEDTGILTAHNSLFSYGTHNCSWIIIAPNPGTTPDFSISISENLLGSFISAFLDSVK